MTLEEAILQGLALTLVCGACGAQTQLDPRFFARRHDLKAELDALAKSRVCPACGDRDVDLVATAQE